MNSTNIKVISEEIQRLKDQVHAIDVEVPDPSQATDGQILSVDDGKYVISDPELPVVTAASTGDVLGLVGEAKTPGWITPYTPIDYSETEQDTGIKWIDGKSIYSKTFIIEPQESGSTTINIPLGDNVDNVIRMYGTIHRANASGGAISDIYDLGTYYSATYHSAVNYQTSWNNIQIQSAMSTGVVEAGYVCVLYTKTAPVPYAETTSTKKKTTKKGE